MNLRDKVGVAYTIFSAGVGSGFLGWQLAQLIWPKLKHHYCEDCKRTIMVSGRD